MCRAAIALTAVLEIAGLVAADDISSAQRRADRYEYLYRVGQAQQALARGDAARANRFLAECAETLRGWEWHYLKRQTEGGTPAFTTHKASPLCLAYSPDGKRIASGDKSGTVHIWDPDSGTVVRTIQVGKNAVNALTFIAGGTQLATWDGHWLDKAGAKIWDVATGKQLHAYGQLPGQFDHAAFSADGKRAAARAYEKFVIVELDRDTPVFESRGKLGYFSGLALLPDGNHVLTWGRPIGPAVIMHDARTGKETLIGPTLRGNVIADYSVAAPRPDGKQLVFAVGVKLTFWDLEGGKAERTLTLKHKPHQLAYSPDGKQVAWASHADIGILDAESGKEVRALTGDVGRLGMLALRPDGQQLASLIRVTQDGKDRGAPPAQIKTWDLVFSADARTLPGAADGVDALAFSSDNRLLATLEFSGRLRVWDVATARELCRSEALAGWSFLIFFRPGDKEICTAGVGSAGNPRVDGIEIWSAADGKRVRTIRSQEMLWLAVSPNRHLLAGQGITIHNLGPEIMNLATGKSMPIHVEGRLLEGYSFSPDSKHVVIASSVELKRTKGDRTGKDFDKKTDDGEQFKKDAKADDDDPYGKNYRPPVASRIVIYDAATGAEVRRLDPGPKGFYPIRLLYSPDGKRICAYSASSHYAVWDATTGKVLQVSPATAYMYVMCFSPDGTRLFVTSTSDTLEVCDPLTGQAALTLAGKYHQPVVSPDGARVAVVSGRDVRLFEIKRLVAPK